MESPIASVGPERAASSGNVGGLRAGVEDESGYVRLLRWRVSKEIYFLLLLSLLVSVLNADVNLLAPVLTPVAREFGFVETYENGTAVMEYDDKLGRMVAKVDVTERDTRLGGDITMAYFTIGGVTSLILGYLSDTVNRRNTLALVVVLGESACLATYFLAWAGYWGLFCTRALTGISIGGAVPLIFSLVGDLFRAEHRGKAIAAVGIAIGAGQGFGQSIAGPVAGQDGSNWRASFLLISIPAYFLAALLVLTVEEPPRGQKEAAFLARQQERQERSEDTEAPQSPQPEQEQPSYSEKITWAKFRRLISTPTVVLVLLQGAFGSLPWGAFGGFMSDFLAEEKGMDIRLTGVVLLIFGVGIMAGAVSAGIVVDKLWARHKRTIPLLLMVTTVAGAVPIVFYVEAKPLDFGLTALLIIPAGFGLGFAGNSTKFLIANVAVPEARGSAFALVNLFDDLGKGVGVYLLSKMFLLFEATPERSARQQGITIAFGVGWPICGIFCGAIYFFIDRDYARAQADVAGAIGNAELALAKEKLVPAKAEIAPADDAEAL